MLQNINIQKAKTNKQEKRSQYGVAYKFIVIFHGRGYDHKDESFRLLS